jgi:fructose-bisphosphate aldolase class 1
MAIVELASTAAALVADGKGILTADETPKILTKRFDALNIHSTAAANGRSDRTLATDY